MNMFFLLCVEALVILGAVELLTRYMPPRLRKSSEENCRRLDGSWSKRRAMKEQKAWWKLRSDLLAGFLVAALIGNAVILSVHLFVMPLPLAGSIAQELRLSSAETKQRILDRRLDRAHTTWYSANGGQRADAESVQRFLWYLWPVFLIVGCVWLAVMAIGVRFVHQRALAEFADGLKYRNERHVVLDLARFPDSPPA